MDEKALDGSGDEYEVISSDEVDRVMAELETLMGTVESETIKSYLAECSDNLYYLVYEDEEGSASEAA